MTCQVFVSGARVERESTGAEAHQEEAIAARADEEGRRRVAALRADGGHTVLNQHAHLLAPLVNATELLAQAEEMLVDAGRYGQGGGADRATIGQPRFQPRRACSLQLHVELCRSTERVIRSREQRRAGGICVPDQHPEHADHHRAA